MDEVGNYSEQIFENIKHINRYGQEFWYARELSRALEYKDFRNFEQIIFKAMDACQNSGFDIGDHSVTSPRWLKLVQMQSVASPATCSPATPAT